MRHMKTVENKVMRKVKFTVSLAVLLCVSQFSHGQISTDEIPDLGNLGLLIGEADDGFVEESVLDSEGKISSGMPVDQSSRGVTATSIASILAQGDLESQQGVEQWLDNARTAFEDKLVQSNFEVNDVGVGLAVAFIMFWEMAEDRILPEESELKLGKYLVHTFKDMAKDPSYQQLSSEDKSRIYDWTMTSSIAFFSMIGELEAKGETEQVEQLRKKSASLFVELFRFPHDIFTISDEGEMGANIESITSYQEQNGLSQEQNGLSDDW